MLVLEKKARQKKLLVTSVFLLSIFSFISPARAAFLPPLPQKQSGAILFGKYALEGVKVYARALGPSARGAIHPFAGVVKNYGKDVASIGWQAPEVAKDFVLQMAMVGEETGQLFDLATVNLPDHAGAAVRAISKNLASTAGAIKELAVLDKINSFTRDARQDLSHRVLGLVEKTKRFMGETVYGEAGSFLSQWFKK